MTAHHTPSAAIAHPESGIPVLTGVRAAATLAALGFPAVAAGIIARRRLTMPLLEKTRADALSIDTFRRLQAQFGRGPVELRLPGRRLVVLLDPDDVTRVLDESPVPFSPANREKRAALGPFQPHGVLISTGAARTRRRQLNEAALQTPRSLHAAADVIAGRVDREIASLAENALASGTLDAARFNQTWWRIVRAVTLGERARDDSELTDRLWKLRSNGNWSFVTPPRRRLRDRFFEDLYRYAGQAEEGTLAHALGAADLSVAVDPVGQIPHWLFAFDAAGIATLRALALLATHQDRLAAARAEASERGRGTAQPLPFLRACILESLRLWPTTPAILRDSTEPTSWRTLTGTTAVVPAGSVFLVLTPPLHRDRERYDFAEAFTPDIWMDGRGDRARALLPFSGGPADCPGRNVALLVSSTALSAVLNAFDRLDLAAPSLRPDVALPPTLNHYGLRFSVSV